MSEDHPGIRSLAATAEQHDATLVTLNRKHFPMVSRLEVPYARPG